MGVGSVQTPTLTKRPWVQTAHNVHLHFRFTGLGCKTCCHVLEARQHAVLQRQSRPSAPQQRAGRGTRRRPPVGVRIGRAGFKYQGPSGVDQKSPWTSGQDRISRTFGADRTERPVIGDVSQAEKDKRCACMWNLKGQTSKKRTHIHRLTAEGVRLVTGAGWGRGTEGEGRRYTLPVMR